VRGAEEGRARESGEPKRPGEPGYSPLAVTGGFDYRDHYFFRGYDRVSSGPMIQPYADVGYTVFDNGRLAVTPHVGAWADFTEEKGPNPPVHVNEFRANAGVAVEVSRFVLDFRYVLYTSPSDVFEKVHEVGVDVRYDDRSFWRHDDCPFVALNPSFSLFHEAEDNNDDEKNTFVGVGLEPTLRPFDVGPLPLTVSFPLTLGGSYDGYYRDDDGHNVNFGYWEAGVRCALPLGRSAYGGRWSVEAELDYVRLLADSAEAANGHDSDDVVFRLGLAFR
jgi:hypothetical protein